MPTSLEAHWGGLLFPSFDERTELGLTFVGFTEFGKEMQPGTQSYLFTPYNDLDKTLGLNLISYSISRARQRNATAYGSSPALQSPTWTSSTIHVGVVDDRFTQFLQNRVIHKPHGLPPVPRDTIDTPNHISAGFSDVIRVVQFDLSLIHI